MLECVEIEFTEYGERGVPECLFRYEMLDRLWASAKRKQIEVLAFGFNKDGLRCVVEGEPSAVANVFRGLKVGSIRSARWWSVRLCAGPTLRWPIPSEDLLKAIEWAHRGDESSDVRGPLANPWTSHRDILGYRQASFFDASNIRQRVDALALHEACGGGQLPEREGHGLVPLSESLHRLLCAAGAVLGVLPADRRCFRLFVHLAKAYHWKTGQIAEALSLTTRRIRQLASQSEPLLDLGLETLSDGRLACFP